MSQNQENNVPIKERILITTRDLASILSCSEDLAVIIGTYSEARYCIEGTTLWLLEKIEKHIVINARE